MKRLISIFLSASLIAIIFLSGCEPDGPTATISTPTFTPTPTLTPTPTRNVMSTDCTNSLWPIKAGAGWSYLSEDGDLGDYTFQSNVIEGGSHSFILQYHYDTGVIVNQSWQCDAGALITLSVGGVSQSLTTINGTYSTLQTFLNSGVTLPATVSPGDTWSQEYTVSGTVTAPSGNTATAEGSCALAGLAGVMESVDVMGSDLEAQQVQTQTTCTLEITANNVTVPVTLITTTTVWYVPGIGPVQMVSSNEMTGTETISLTGYNVP